MKPIPTIASLRQAGYRVFVTHKRLYGKTQDLKNKSEVKGTWSFQDLQAKGGLTHIELILEEASYISEAHCSVKDNYNRKTGATIALGRLLHQLPTEKLDEIMAKVGDM